ncbi:MAG: hypothetical protein AAGD38_02825 [Acidobacteriota bacterium]
MFRKTLLFVCVLALVATAGFAQTPPYTKTIIVGDTGNPVLNGTNLLAAIATPATPSATDRWLVFVEPGIYDIAASTLTMRDYVDLQGSGRNSTVITSFNAVTITAPAGISAEIRDLTVANDRNFQGGGTGILIQTEEFRVSVVNVEVQNVTDATGIEVQTPFGRPRLLQVFPSVSGSVTATGLRVQSGGVIVNEMFVFILSSSSGANTGIFVQGLLESQLGLVNGFVSGSSAQNVGIEVVEANPVIRNNSWSVIGSGNADGLGLLVSTPNGRPSAPVVRETAFQGDGTTTSAGARLTGVAATTFQQSLLDGGIGVGIEAIDTSNTQVDVSVVEGALLSLRATALTTLNIGGTKLNGTRFVTGISQCVNTWDGVYLPIPNGPC